MPLQWNLTQVDRQMVKWLRVFSVLHTHDNEFYKSDSHDQHKQEQEQ